MKTVRESARNIPVTHETDVVVAGGGTAGVACAVCAARMGLSVIMIENSTQPGGMVTHVTQWTGDFDNKGGFPQEFLEHLLSNGIMERPYYNLFRVVSYFDELIKDSGVLPLYLCRVVAPLVEDGQLQGVIVESKQGRHAIESKIVIDATGDGDVAAGAGAEFEYGREADGKIQAVSLSHAVQNFPQECLNLQEEVVPAIKALNPDYQLPYDHGNIRRQQASANGLLIGLPHVTNCNPLEAESLSSALVNLRGQANEICDFLRRSGLAPELEPGMFSAVPGVRESRRIVCDKMVADQDIYRGTQFNDGLFTVEHGVDIHKCTEAEPAIVLKKCKPYQIPYGALLPKGLSNIMVIGRCIGGGHEALASYRLIADCFAMGEAAALAAEQALRLDKDLRDIVVSEIYDEMTARGYRESSR